MDEPGGQPLARLVGKRSVAQRLSYFGANTCPIGRLTRSHQPTSHRLPSGLQVWMLLRMQARDGVAAPVFHMAGRPVEEKPRSASEPDKSPPETLRHGELHLIEAALANCQGNVSQAARSLGVSRGLIYRHLKQGKEVASH